MQDKHYRGGITAQKVDSTAEHGAETSVQTKKQPVKRRGR